MDKLIPFLITVAIILAVMAATYRINFLHKLVFGKGSARVNQAAKLAVSANPATPAVGV